jgi:hypothetical protein
VFDPALSLQEKDEAIIKAENEVTYKDAKEPEIKKLRAQWKRRTEQGTNL